MNRPEEQLQNDANELTNVPNPLNEELSEDELDKIAGGGGAGIIAHGETPMETHGIIVVCDNSINFRSGK